MNIYAMKKPKRINAVSITFFILALGVGYLGWAFIPIYWPVFQLSGIMRGVCNDAYRVHDDKQLMEKLLKDSRRTGLRVSQDNFRLTRLPYSEDELIALSNGRQAMRNMLIKRGKQCMLEMHYEDDFALPLLDKKLHIPFDKTVVQTLEQIDYEMCTCVRAQPAER